MNPERRTATTPGGSLNHSLQSAVDEYVEAMIFEADETAAEGEALLWGPRSQAAKQRLQRAYERLYELSAHGQAEEPDLDEGLLNG